MDGKDLKNCPVAKALGIVGEKWSLLIIRDLLLLGRVKFQEFERRIDGIAPNTLSARLKSLEESGIISAELYERHPPRLEYFLTDKGKALGPIVKSLYVWGKKYG